MKTTVIGLALFALFCFAAAEEQLVRVAHYEPVLNFQLNKAEDGLSFRAYGKVWQFAIWVSGVALRSEHSEGHYFGRLLGESSQISSFTVLEGHTTGMIVTSNDTFWLEAKDSSKPDELFIYRTSDVWFHPSVQNLKCKHAGEQAKHEGDDSEDLFHLESRGTLSSAVYLDQYWTSPANNPSWNSVDATYGLLNDVNAIYASAGLSGFAFSINGRLDNSWTQNSQTNDMLTYFSQWASNAGISPQYNAVAWLVGNNVGGLAWLSSACGRYGNYYKTSVSGLSYWSRLWTVKTIAHEFGHNRGADHDFNAQCAQNQGSGCQCSVMSYCFPNAQTAGGAVNYFSPTSINEIAATCN